MSEMDVLGGGKNEHGLYRRRLLVDTPEINTYQRQILFCEKKYDKLNQKFRVPEIKHGAAFTSRTLQRPPPTECWTNTSVAARGSRKSSVDNFHAGLSRRKSSFQHVSRKQSLISPQKLESHHASPQKPIANRAVGRCSSESRVVAKDNVLSHGNNKVSRRDSESIVRNGAGKDNTGVQEISNKQDQESETTRVEAAGSTSGALEELGHALRLERDHFLRALTTLAINRITTDKPSVAPVERNTTFTHYERNIDVLADGSRLTLDEDCVAPHLTNDNNNKDGSSASESSGSDIYGAVGEDAQPNSDKRERINRLRSYLKCSGFGDPDMVKTTVRQSEDEKRALCRLIRRINRGLSCEKQERLRRKARLEYEMSLMKGESFCEQQEQVYMRTASADMENRDVQLLEEELRIQALQEIRQSKRDIHKNQKSLNRQQSSSREMLNEGYQRHSSQNINASGEQAAMDENGNGNPDVDEKSSSDDRDAAMSGLIRNPVSRREMRKRILLWVFDVEEATGVSHKEEDKMEKKLVRKDSKFFIGGFDPDAHAVNAGVKTETGQ